MSSPIKGKIHIHLTENESTELDDKGGVKNIGCAGILSIKNPSTDHRLWNLKMNLDQTSLTNLPKSSQRQTLESGSLWDFLYKVDPIKDPILKLTETFNTSRERHEINSYYYLNVGDHVSITLVLKNVSDRDIQNIVLQKQIPQYLKELRIDSTSLGKPDLDIENKYLTWKIPQLAIEETATLIIGGRADIKDSLVKSGNPVEVTYESDMNSRSKVKSKVEALTDSMSGVEQEEDDTKPGWWNCTVEFDNNSDFEVTLTNVKVHQKVPTGDDTIVSLTPNFIIAAEKSWKHNFSIQSPGVPSLTPKLDFTANYVVTSKVVGKIVQDHQTFTVVETSTTKTINPPAVKANANTDMTITNVIVNTGTAPIATMQITDLIPKDFQPPTLDQIALSVVRESGEAIKLDVQRASLEMSPDNHDSTMHHKIMVTCTNLKEILKPKCKLMMVYPLIARNPQPNVTYDTPLTVLSNTVPAGIGYPDKPKELPNIGITYVKRKVKTMKAINPTGREGTFNIVIKIVNNGGVELENITVVEDVPPGFKAGEFKPADTPPEHKEKGDASSLKWHIVRLDPDQSIKYEFISQGKGEYPRTEPQVIIAEPDSLKAPTPQPTTPHVPTVMGESARTVSAITDLFNQLGRALVPGISYEKAAQHLENLRNKLLDMGKTTPALHEILTEIRELRKFPDKSLIGAKLDELTKKINDWRNRIAV